MKIQFLRSYFHMPLVQAVVDQLHWVDAWKKRRTNGKWTAYSIQSFTVTVIRCPNRFYNSETGRSPWAPSWGDPTLEPIQTRRPTGPDRTQAVNHSTPDTWFTQCQFMHYFKALPLFQMIFIIIKKKKIKCYNSVKCVTLYIKCCHYWKCFSMPRQLIWRNLH